METQITFVEGEAELLAQRTKYCMPWAEVVISIIRNLDIPKYSYPYHGDPRNPKPQILLSFLWGPPKQEP